MRRKCKVFAALLLTLALAVCLALPSWALSSTSTGVVQITGLEESSGVTVKAYKIMTVNWYNGSATPPYEESPEYPTFKWDTNVNTWLEGNSYSNYKDSSGNVTEAFSQMAEGSASAAEKFYTNLAKAIKATTVSISNPFLLSIGTGSDGISASGRLPMGGYLILVEGGTKIYSPVFVTVMPTYDETSKSWKMPDPATPCRAAVKQQDLTFEKKIVADNNSLIDKDTVGINSTVTFRLTAAIPKYLENAHTKLFNISDNLPVGMTLDANLDTGTGFIVTGYTSSSDTQGTLLTFSTDYTVAEHAGHDADFTLEFKYDSIKLYDFLTVQYSVTMNKDTVVKDNSSADGNINTAYLDYTKDQLTGTSDYLESNATVYSYGIKVDKVDQEDPDTHLSGAIFTLHRAGTDGQATGEPIKFYQAKDDADKGIYRVATQSEIQSTPSGGTVTTNLEVGKTTNKGKLQLSGLDVDTYILTEVQAPAGYNKPSASVSVTIKDDGVGENTATLNGKPEYTPQGGTETEAEDGYVPVKVTNTKGFTLPSTGGMGTVLFTAFGILLMGAGLVVLVLFLRRRSTK